MMKVLLALAALLMATPSLLHAQGLMVPFIGPVNRSMGSAAVAAPLDAMGAVYWNPATMSALPSSELGFGMCLGLADIETASVMPANAFGIPTGAGATGAEPGVTPVPNIGWVHHTSNPRVSYGLGLAAVAGFKTNFPVDPSNPILTAPLGARIYTEAQFLEMLPSMSYAITDRLSIGFGPTITMGKIDIDPFIFAAPNATGAYPSGRGTRMHFGGGAQLGVYWISPNHWHFGSSIKSPQWMEEFRYHSENAAGLPRLLKRKLDLPMIISLGAAYSGFENWVFALDLRYYDYKNTDLFGDPASFTPAGAVTGLGWSSVFSLAAGAQCRVNDSTYVRMGYLFTQSPTHSSETFVNIGAPLYYQHIISAGATMQLSGCLALNFAYSYLVEDSITGLIVVPGVGAVPGSSVSSELSAHFASVGATVRY